MKKNPSVSVCNYGGEVFAWWNHGSHCFPLTEEEKKMSNQKIRGLIFSYLIEAKVRCTECKKDLPIQEIAGYPLFAGVACGECWKKHCQELEEEKAKGHVCSLCGEPYGACCC